MLGIHLNPMCKGGSAREVSGTASPPPPSPTSAASLRTLLTCFSAAAPVSLGSPDKVHRAPHCPSAPKCLHFRTPSTGTSEHSQQLGEAPPSSALPTGSRGRRPGPSPPSSSHVLACWREHLFLCQGPKFQRKDQGWFSWGQRSVPVQPATAKGHVGTISTERQWTDDSGGGHPGPSLRMEEPAHVTVVCYRISDLCPALEPVTQTGIGHPDSLLLVELPAHLRPRRQAFFSPPLSFDCYSLHVRAGLSAPDTLHLFWSPKDEGRAGWPADQMGDPDILEFPGCSVA